MRNMEEGASRTRNKSNGQRQPSNKRVSEPILPQRRASWGSKERPATAATARQNGTPGRSPSAPQTARNGTPNKTHATPSRASDTPGVPSPAGVHRVARQILASSPTQDVVHINLQHPITSYISPSETSVSSKVPSPGSPGEFPPPQDEVSTNRPDEAELLRAELVELKRSFQAREAQLVQQVESLCSQLAAASCARDAAEAELRTLRGELASQTACTAQMSPSPAAGGMDEELRRHGRELQRLASAFSALELDSQERQMAAERSCAAHVKHLEELIRSSQSQQQQFCSDLQALWAEVSRQRASPAAAAPAAPVEALNGARPRARTGEERMNDLAANALLRNIYSAVSELP